MKFTDTVRGGKQTITDEGYLIVKGARIARTGMQEYLAVEMGERFSDKEPTDKVVVYRPEDEVFSEESLASFELQPVTDDHPPSEITVKNIKGFAVGVASNIRREGRFVLADVKITDEDMILKIKAGKRELSNGYKAEIVRKEGVTKDGVMYDAVQTKIRGNHIAIVDQARCGPLCSLSDNQPNRGESMKVTIAGVPFEVKDESLAAAVQNVLNQNADLASQVQDSKSNVDTATQALKDAHKDELQKVQAQLDQAKANEITPEKLDAVIADRMSIVDSARKVIADLDPKGKTCMEIKREALVSRYGDSLTEKLKDDAYTNARFDALVEHVDDASNTDSMLRDAVTGQGSTKVAVSDSQRARQRKVVMDRLAYKFAPGARATAHPQHATFMAAVEAELAQA